MNNMSIGDRILEIGHKFSNRIDVGILNGALSYVDHNEDHLAIDTFCEHLLEFETRIQRDEYDELCKLVADMGLDENAPPYRYLSQLLVS
ncbi:MafI family immunity protein [Agrobacterium sp. Azo12]|jgi:hypothetical protein|uniref:MafI family immunity protein n=1 Tax=Agrobacterium sp. Azo12 TaxID=3031129 RepID=UPI0023D7C5CE|nr:MafI family immunity protein [Agrobacterium sp. Azo12]MDO5897870.1 MafI family immunity protein [Agrobacterium sp. Azo12]